MTHGHHMNRLGRLPAQYGVSGSLALPFEANT